MPYGVYVRTKEHSKNLSLSHLGQKSWNTGKTLSEEHKYNLSEAHKGKVLSEEHKEKLSKAGSGKLLPEEQKKKISESVKLSYERRTDLRTLRRLTRIKNIELNHGILFPGFNKQACEYFKKFDEENNTQGRYAVYGGGEYFIKELGYYPDYINFDKKLIIEWDEKDHYVAGKLSERDVVRQKEIQELYPDFEFRRIRD